MNNQTNETLKHIAAKQTLGLPLTEHEAAVLALYGEQPATDAATDKGTSESLRQTRYQITPKTDTSEIVPLDAQCVLGLTRAVKINGVAVPLALTAAAVVIMSKYKDAIKRVVTTPTDGGAVVDIELYAATDPIWHNHKYADIVDVWQYCPRHACIDCGYFDHDHLVRLNHNCPLLKLKDLAIKVGYAQINADYLTKGAAK